MAHIALSHENLDGRTVYIKNRPYVNFGSYSYLGYETDHRVLEASITAIRKYGIVMPSSRAYLNSYLYGELEEKCRQIFNNHIVITNSLSLGHHGILPVLVNETDLILLDQNVHASVQEAAYKLQREGTGIKVVRHNDSADVEAKINEYHTRFDKIWYLADSVYSMFGDVAHIESFFQLTKKYKNFNIYYDEAHATSVFGKNGNGLVSNHHEITSQVVLAQCMAKGMGAMGAAYVFSDADTAEKCRNTAGSLIFSGQQSVPVLAASNEVARIMLTDEHAYRQRALKEKMNFCHHIFEDFGLPDISHKDTPIFFVGTGLQKTAYRLANQLIAEGFFVNTALFPAVPENGGGIRFTVNLHTTQDDIYSLAKAFKKHYLRSLEEEGRTLDDIYKGFRKYPHILERLPDLETGLHSLHKPMATPYIYDSITAIDKNLWENTVGAHTLLSYAYMRSLENTLDGVFKYLVVKEKENIIGITFFTATRLKDDMLSHSSISRQVEQKRQEDPGYLVSKYLVMGSVASEGQHYHIEPGHEKTFFETVYQVASQLAEDLGCNSLLFRDFDSDNTEIAEIFTKSGMIKIEMPESLEIHHLKGHTLDSYLASLRGDYRRYLKQKIAGSPAYTVEIDNRAIDELYPLYIDVVNKSHTINLFALPKRFFTEALKTTGFEVIAIRHEGKLVSGLLACKNQGNYCPLFIGLDANYIEKDIYPFSLYQYVKRAIELHCDNLYMGYTANQNKRKLGATEIKKCAYLQSKDSFSRSELDTYYSSRI